MIAFPISTFSIDSDLNIGLAACRGLEIELVPRKVLPAVQAIVRGGDAAARPAYVLGNEVGEGDLGESDNA